MGNQPDPCSLSLGHSPLPQCCAPSAGICDLDVFPHSGVSRYNARNPGQGESLRLLSSLLRRAEPVFEFSDSVRSLPRLWETGVQFRILSLHVARGAGQGGCSCCGLCQPLKWSTRRGVFSLAWLWVLDYQLTEPAAFGRKHQRGPGRFLYIPVSEMPRSRGDCWVRDGGEDLK